MLAVARAAQAHVAEPLPAGKGACLPLVEQPRRVRQLPESGEQSAVRPPLDGEPVAAAQHEDGVLLRTFGALRRLDRQGGRRAVCARETKLRERAVRALRRAVRAADGRAELHERLREIAAVPGGVARAQRRGERRLVRGVVDGRRVVEHARAHAQHVAVHGGGRPLEADRGDRPGGVWPDARQRAQTLDRVRPDAAARRDHAGAFLRLARAVIVPQPLPELEQLRLRQRRESEHVRRGREKARIIPAHGLDARLLQHDLREPHVVRLAVGAPRQRARAAPVPAEQRLHDLRESVCVHGCTSRKNLRPL